jgi:hypothetical protein
MTKSRASHVVFPSLTLYVEVNDGIARPAGRHSVVDVRNDGIVHGGGRQSVVVHARASPR